MATLVIENEIKIKNFIKLIQNIFTSRAAIRFVSSLLHKVVDSLAPSVTLLLVRGKTVSIPIKQKLVLDMICSMLFKVTLGVFGYEESIIDSPVG